MNMIEKVARAIKQAEHSQSDINFFLLYAKAAITAMREPADEMLKACEENLCRNMTRSSEGNNYYQAMIDAALKD